MQKDKSLVHWLIYLIIAALIIGSTFVSQNQTSSQVAWLNGIDVSGHQHPRTVQHPEGEPIDWPKVYESGQRFAFVKATEGTHYIHKHFRTDMEQGRNAGISMGIYHFARPVKNTATDEARFFIKVARPYLAAGYLRPVLDIEDVEAYSEYPCRELGKEKLSAWIHEWAKLVEIEIGIKPILYVTSSYARNCLKESLAEYSLWIAHWKCNPNAFPKTGIWNSWHFWQYYAPEYCGRNYIPGIRGPVDLDLFNGETLRLVNFQIIPAVACQISEKLSIGQGVYTTDELRVRTEPGLASPIIETVKKETSGVILEGPIDKDGYTWWLVRYFATTGWSAGEFLKPRLIIQPFDCLTEISLREFVKEVKEAIAKKDIDFFITKTIFQDVSCKEYRESPGGGFITKEPPECQGKTDQTLVPSIFIGYIASEGFPIPKQEFQRVLTEILSQSEPAKLYGVIYPDPFERNSNKAHLILLYLNPETKDKEFQIFDLFRKENGSWSITEIFARGYEEEVTGFSDDFLYPPPPTNIFYQIQELFPQPSAVDVQKAKENALKKVLRDEEGNPLISKDKFRQHLLINKDSYQIVYQELGDIFIIFILGSPFEAFREKAEEEFLALIEASENIACQLKVEIKTPMRINPEQAGKIFPLSFC